MKTLEEMLNKAALICENDPNSRVAIYFTSYKHLWDTLNYCGLSCMKRNLTYNPEGGGVLHLLYFNQEPIIHRIAGLQLTHAFITDFSASYEDVSHIKSRIRYVNKPCPEPSGVYWPTHVERCEQY